MLGKQDQKVAEGGYAIQAARDVIVQGASISDVREVCNLVFQANFPTLRQEARLAAEEHVQKFIETLEQKLSATSETINVQKFRDPDVQACMNDAIQAAARRGNQSNQDLLCSLISERVKFGQQDFKDIVLSEAIKVAPRMSKEQVAVLCTLFFGRYMNLPGITQLSNLRPLSNAVLTATRDYQVISETQLMHLTYLGVTTYINSTPDDIYAQHNSQYSLLRLTSGDVFKNKIEQEAPEHALLLKRYTENKLWRHTLTSVGQAICAAALSKSIPNINLDTWIN